MPLLQVFSTLKVKSECLWIVSVILFYKFILYMCVWVCLILIVYVTFCYNIICVNYDVCGFLCVQ